MLRKAGFPAALFAGLMLVCGSVAMAAENDTVGLKVRQTEQWGPVIVDQKGRSLYVFSVDDEGTDVGNCYEDCSDTWPPLIWNGMPKLGPDVKPSLVSSIVRKDGQRQVTYDDWPLYYYSSDQEQNDTQGQNKRDHGGLWHLIAPDGHVLTRRYEATPSPDVKD